tara:strand:- start:6452 stop:7357 length:906 start_codon:yes stop_codon:yes gene_type:complete
MLTIFKIAPKQLSISKDGKEVWGSELYESRITIINTEKLTTKRVIRLRDKGTPVEIVHTNNGKEAWVSILNKRRVHVYDAKTHKLLHKIRTGREPKGIAFSPDGRWAIVSNWKGRSITLIDRKTYKRVRDVRVSPVPRGVIFTKDGKEAWVASFVRNCIDILSVPDFKIIKTIKGLPRNPRHFAQTKDGKTMYLTTNGGGKLLMFDIKSRKLKLKLRTGRGQRTITLSPDERFAYVANYYSKNISVIRLKDHKIIETIPADRMCIGMVLTPDGKKLFVTNYNMYRVMVFNTPKHIWTRPSP